MPSAFRPLTPAMACLEDTRLLAFVEGALAGREAAAIDEHVGDCWRCLALVADFVRAHSTDRSVTVISEQLDALVARSMWSPTAAGSAAAGGEPEATDPEGEAGTPEPDGGTVGRRYVLGDLIGQGGMGKVFRALDRLSGDTVALKRVALRPRHPATGATGSRRGTIASGLESLAREFRTLATLRHPSIISVLDYGFDERRQPFFTMELLERARPILPLARSAPRALQIDLLIQLLRALDYLHRRGVLHRDLKPSNILVVEGESASRPLVKLVDFGLSSGSDEAHLRKAAGTLPYMAPELLRGAPASAASDLYAVGILACEMLTGRHPLGPFDHFAADREAAPLIRQMLHAQPDLSRLPRELAAVIGRALARSPSDRPARAIGFARELAQAAGVEPGDEPRAARDSYLVAARFIGREAELGRLEEALAAAQGGRGSAWLIGGESGVGKSRLLEELRGRALVEGVLVIRGQALAAAGNSYQLWCGVLEVLALHVDLDPLEASVLGDLMPHLGALLDRAIAPPPILDVQATRARLLHVMRDVVGRSRVPMMLLLEDLQWADGESLALLAQISAAIDTLPVLITATCRDDEAPRLPALLPSMQVLRLLRLDRSGIERMCEAMLGPPPDARAVDVDICANVPRLPERPNLGGRPDLIGFLERQTEGNTWFIIETLRALAEESGPLAGSVDDARPGLPERILAGGIEQVLGRRLARVPPEARAFLRLAAVAGRQLDPPMLSRCLPSPLTSSSPSPSIDSLIQLGAEAGVLEMHEQHWRFRHDKLRERVLGELDAAEKTRLHARIADGLELAHPPSSVHAARIAHHRRQAGQLAEAAHLYALAGEAELLHGAPAAAEAALEEARVLQDVLGVPALARVRVWRGLAQARFGLGQLRQTDAAVRRVCELAGQPLPESQPGLGWRVGAQVVEQIARRAGLGRHLPREAWAATHRELAEQLLLALVVQEEVYVWLGRPELFLLCTLWGLNLEETLGPPRRTNFPLALAFLFSYTPLGRLGRHYLERGADAVRPDNHFEVEVLRGRALNCLNQGDWQEAAAYARRAVDSARAQKNDVSLLQSLFLLEMAQCGLDQYPEVLATCLEMERLSTQTENPRSLALSLIGQGSAQLCLGAHREAAALLERAHRSLPAELGPVPEAIVLALIASCANQQGIPSRAREIALNALVVANRSQWDLVDIRYALGNVVGVLLDVGDLRADRADIEHALQRLHRISRHFRFARPDTLLLQGRYQWLRGHPARAARLFQRSLAEALTSGARAEQARAHHWLGRLARTDHGPVLVPAGPTHHLRAALKLFERLGFQWEAQRVRDLMAGARREPFSKFDDLREQAGPDGVEFKEALMNEEG